MEDVAFIGFPVTLDDIERTLKIFAKDKNPGLDGWPV